MYDRRSHSGAFLGATVDPPTGPAAWPPTPDAPTHPPRGPRGEYDQTAAAIAA